MVEVPVKIYIDKVLKQARNVAKPLALLPAGIKNKALLAMAARLAADEETILEANLQDVESVGKTLQGETNRDRVKEAVDRLRLTADSIKEMTERLRVVADLPDPVGETTQRWEQPNGMHVSRVRVPIGVIGIISEFAPLVTVESAALCLKSGNVCVFRGAPEWGRTHHIITTGLREAAEQAGVPVGALSFIERPEKDAALELMRATRMLDAIIPRGGAGLRKAVIEQSRVPVLCHDGGVCHIYIDEDVDLPMAQNIVINSKAQQPAASNSLDTMLIHQAIARSLLPPLINRLLIEFKMDVLACPKTDALMGTMAISGHKSIKPAGAEDWGRQFLSRTLAVKMVKDMDEALAHIAQYGPGHTDTIITKNYDAAMRFAREVDSSAVLVNASTRLHAGEHFGQGAEMGTSTSRIHARGPIGLEELTCEKYVVFGTGQLRQPHPVPVTYEDAIMLKRPS
ncbi:MAG: glutamate-5-semialdehyde dehydrogenase [Nitrospiraceae bacterium]